MTDILLIVALVFMYNHYEKVEAHQERVESQQELILQSLESYE